MMPFELWAGSPHPQQLEGNSKKQNKKTKTLKINNKGSDPFWEAMEKDFPDLGGKSLRRRWREGSRKQQQKNFF